MAFWRVSLIPFFFLSLLLHLSVFFSWPKPAPMERTWERIPVTVLPTSEERKNPGRIEANAAKPVRSQPKGQIRVPAPARVANRPDTAAADLTPEAHQPAEKKSEKVDAARRPEERDILAPRPLPNLKELLPSVNWSLSGEGTINREEPVRLDTREPQYVSYFTSIKRAIELVWEYPELALQHGLQGKLVLEFTILRDGNLVRARLIRSSGFPVLDEEAMRAVQAAAPFHPIPQWIGKHRLDILASFEYHDNRLKYSFTP